MNRRPSRKWLSICLLLILTVSAGCQSYTPSDNRPTVEKVEQTPAELVDDKVSDTLESKTNFTATYSNVLSKNSFTVTIETEVGTVTRSKIIRVQNDTASVETHTPNATWTTWGDPSGIYIRGETTESGESTVYGLNTVPLDLQDALGTVQVDSFIMRNELVVLNESTTPAGEQVTTLAPPNVDQDPMNAIFSDYSIQDGNVTISAVEGRIVGVTVAGTLIGDQVSTPIRKSITVDDIGETTTQEPDWLSDVEENALRLNSTVHHPQNGPSYVSLNVAQGMIRPSYSLEITTPPFDTQHAPEARIEAGGTLYLWQDQSESLRVTTTRPPADRNALEPPIHGYIRGPAGAIPVGWFTAP